MALKVLVTGGRRYPHVGFVWEVLDRVHAEKGIDTIIHGATPTRLGADWAADDWAKYRGVGLLRFYVDPALDGAWPAAGNRRNMRMLFESRPHGVIAFPGGSGTSHMVQHALTQGYKVWDLRAVAPPP